MAVNSDYGGPPTWVFVFFAGCLLALGVFLGAAAAWAAACLPVGGGCF